LNPPTEDVGAAPLAVLLAAVAGSVDGVCFVTLYQMFVAHMSGNSAALGVDLAMAQWPAALARFFPIPLFVLGTILGALLYEHLRRRNVQRRLSIVLVIEGTLLAIFALWGSTIESNGQLPRDPAWRFFILAAMPVLAVALQNATLHRVGHASVHTTFVTGILSSFADGVAKSIYMLADLRKGGASFVTALQQTRQAPQAAQAVLFAGIWLAYLAGAGSGAWLHTRAGLAALILPLIGIGTAVLLDVFRPVHPE